MATNVSLTTDNPSWTWTEAEADTEYNFQLGVSGAEVNFTGAGSVLANFDGSNPFTIYAEDTNLEIGNLNGGAGDQPITIEVGPNSVIGFDQFQPQWLDNLTIDFAQSGGTGTVAMNVNNITTNPTDVLHVTGASGGASFQFIGATPDHAELNDDGVIVFYDANNQPLLQMQADGVTQDDLDNLTFGEDGTVTFACFLRGTLITTVDGEKRVEDLQPGDKLRTASGGVATVKWLGHRALFASRIPQKTAVRVFPVRIAAGALADGVPARDLYVSPGHHMYFDGKLIPAMLLVNGKTITQDFSLRHFQYFHIELENFDILLSEGAPSESYVDTGNRMMFENVDAVSLVADFGPPEGRPAVEHFKVVKKGPEVVAIRKRLLKRAAMLTESTRLFDPGLRVEVNGQTLVANAESSTESVLRFTLPAATDIGDLHIVSRSAVVRETSVNPLLDLRKVGVGLARVTIEDEAGRRDIDLSDSQLAGLHAPRDLNGVAMRWTDGRAVIPQSLHQAQGRGVLELHVVRTYAYWETSQAQQLAA